MQPDNLARFVDEVAQAYPNATRTTETSKTFLRLPKVHFQPGCLPAETPALVVLEGGQAPQLLIKTLPKLANGREPRSCSATTLAGETWYTFSFTFTQPWDENRHTALQFIEGRLRRFARDE